jgi:type II secretory pathway pseudopilin PulG
MSLIEALLAIVILGIALASVAQAFITQRTMNELNEQRSGAAAAAQQAMESLRRQDPASMPTSGSSSPQTITVDGRDYQVVTSYCVASTYCGAGSRHLRLEVSFAGRDLFDVETVYTQLR